MKKQPTIIEIVNHEVSEELTQALPKWYCKMLKVLKECGKDEDRETGLATSNWSKSRDNN